MLNLPFSSERLSPSFPRRALLIIVHRSTIKMIDHRLEFELNRSTFQFQRLGQQALLACPRLGAQMQFGRQIRFRKAAIGRMLIQALLVLGDHGRIRTQNKHIAGDTKPLSQFFQVFLDWAPPVQW